MQIESIVTTSEISRRGRPRDNATEMANLITVKADENPEYPQKLGKFAATLQRARGKALLDAGQTGKAVKVVIDTGRKLDKIFVSVSTEVNGRFRTNDVEFFVERATGAIYGPKSNFAPNFNRWFGTLDTIGEFNWSERWPVATSERFVVARKYDDCPHYKLREEEVTEEAVEEVAVA
jgi:hypothetical protein